MSPTTLVQYNYNNIGPTDIIVGLERTYKQNSNKNRQPIEIST